MMVDEIWKPVVGYEGLYEVSSYGRVRSLDRYITTNNGHIQFFHGKILSQQLTQRGYYSVCLCKGKGTNRICQVHRIVGYTFLGNPSKECTDINHKDGNKLNNHVENLEWCTRSQNIQHAFDTGLRQYTENQRQASIKALGIPVYCIDNDTIYASELEASRQLHISKDQVRDSVKRHGKICQKGVRNTKRYRIINLNEKDNYIYKKQDQSLLYQEGRYARIANTNKIYMSINKFCEDTGLLYQSVHRNIQCYNGYIPDIDICLVDCGYETKISKDEIDYNLDNKFLYDGRRKVLNGKYKNIIKCSNGHTYLSSIKFASKYFTNVNKTYVDDCIRLHNGHAQKLNLDFYKVSPLDLTNDEVDEIWSDFLENNQHSIKANRSRRTKTI